MVLTAKEWGWSPTAVIRCAKAPHKHHPADYNFAQAVQSLMEEKCGTCNQPTWHAYSSNPDIDFELQEITCHACEYKEQNAPEPKDRKPGQNHVVRAVPADEDAVLPSRSDFMKEQLKKHQKKHAEELARKAKEQEQAA